MDKDPVPKVSVHGSVIKTLSSGIYLTRTLDGKLSSSLLILVVCLIVGYLAVNSAPWSSWVGTIVLVVFVLLSFVLFYKNHTITPLAVPATAGASTFFLGLIVMLVVEQKAKGRLKGMFGSYVSADLVEQMVESGEEPHLGGEETAITAFFSGDAGFLKFFGIAHSYGIGRFDERVPYRDDQYSSGGKRYLGQIHWGRHCRDVWCAHTHGGSCLSIRKDRFAHAGQATRVAGQVGFGRGKMG